MQIPSLPHACTQLRAPCPSRRIPIRRRLVCHRPYGEEFVRLTDSEDAGGDVGDARGPELT